MPLLGVVLFLIIGVSANAGVYSWSGSWPPPNIVSDSSVPFYATVTQSPPAITLHFPRPDAYQIFRKDPSASGSSCWGTALTTLPSNSTSWTDTSVNVGQLYEYKAIMTDGSTYLQYQNPIHGNTNAVIEVGSDVTLTPFPGSTSGTLGWPTNWGPLTYSYPSGYLLTGIAVDQTQPRGRVILVVATDVQVNLPNELAQFEADLTADGWFIHVIPVAPSSGYDIAGINALSSITVASGGSGYVNNTNVGLTSILGGTATAVGTLTVSSGTITSVKVLYPGGGFTVGSPLYMSPAPSGYTMGGFPSLSAYQASLAAIGAPLSGSGAFLTVKTVTSNSTNSISAVSSLLAQIKAIYNAYPGQVENVILLGEIPACMTGAGDVYDPDGHCANDACYAADAYYASMTAVWTDTASNYSQMGSPDNINASLTFSNLNLPGDGKFDQYYLSQTGGEADMGFGRIDLSNNIDGQYCALQSYLNKLHRYKTADPTFQPGRRLCFREGNPYCTTDETFLTFALSITGNPGDIDLIPGSALPGGLTVSFDADAAYTAQHGPYLFYEKGSGGPAGGVGGEAVLWGGCQSHWGFWYNGVATSGQNDMQLRLAENSDTLAFHWDVFGTRYFSHRLCMGMDEGDMMRVSINNVDPINGTYAWVSDPNGWKNWGATYIPCSGALFMDLMGDPTLRLFMFPPPTGLSVVNSGGQPTLTWTASAPMSNPKEPSVIGYHVYRTPLVSGTLSGPATRLTSTPVTGTAYIDTDPTAGPGSGQWSYMVRAVRMETTGGGTFYNASLGAVQSIDMTNGPSVLQIATSGSLPAAYWNTAYPTMLAARGGTPPYSWSVVSGTLPSGLALTTGGTFSGLPTTATAYSFKAQATDDLGQTAQQIFTIAVQSDNEIVLFPQASAYVYSSAPTRIQGAVENSAAGGGNGTDTLLRYNLAGLNLNNSFVSATLQLYIAPGTSSNCSASLEAALSADAAGAAWNCDAVSYNTMPADNSAGAPAVATTLPVPSNYVDIDVSSLVRTALAGNTSNTVSFRVFAMAHQTVDLCTGYSYGAAIPQLIIQTTNAPKITITSPAVTPVYLYVNSGLQINATVTAIPATSANLTTAWSKVSGPGTATFSSPSHPSTTVTFSAPGDYVLQLFANDGVLQSSQTVAVTVLPTAVITTTPAAGPVNNLLMWLPLDETAGSIAHDVSGVSPANSGSLAYVVSGSTNPLWSPTGGRTGGALVFSGSAGQQVIVPDSAANPLDGTSQMSISFWAYLNANDPISSDYHALVCKRKSSGTNESFTIALRAGYLIYFDVGHSTLTNGFIPVPGQWYHFVMVFDGTKSTNNLMFYTNGVADVFGTTYSSGTIPQTTVPRNALANLHIGAYDSNDTLGWNGLIDDVRIYNTALTIPQIQALYAAVPSDIGPVISLNSSVSGTAGIPFSLAATVTGSSAPALQWGTLSGPGNALFTNPTAALTNATCPFGGLYTLQLSANDGSITTFGDVSANISGIAGFAAWASGNGLTGLNATEMAIPAKDSISNLLKYALNLSPLADGAEGLPTVGSVTVNGTNYLSLSYTQVLGASDITYTPEVSGDLQIWNFGSNYTSVVSTTPNAGGLTQTVVVRDLVPFAGASKRFIHLRVVGP